MGIRESVTMTEKYAKINRDSGIVSNVILLEQEDDYPTPDSVELVQVKGRSASPGDRYDFETEDFERQPRDENVPPEPVDRTKISPDTADAIRTARADVVKASDRDDLAAAVDSLQDELDMVLDVLDVIDLDG